MAEWVGTNMEFKLSKNTHVTIQKLNRPVKRSSWIFHRWSSLDQFAGFNISGFRLLGINFNLITHRPEVIVLSERDGKLFLNAIKNPPKPNKALKKLFKKHGKKK
jgi:hypothetical protein